MAEVVQEPPPCPACGSPNVVGVEQPIVYHGILYWLCTACEHSFHRFSPTSHHMRHVYASAEAEMRRARGQGEL